MILVKLYTIIIIKRAIIQILTPKFQKTSINLDNICADN